MGAHADADTGADSHADTGTIAINQVSFMNHNRKAELLCGLLCY